MAEPAPASPADAPERAAQFVLASASPRRAQFLADAGYAFRVVAADVPEVPGAGEAPLAYALRVAAAKAQAAFARDASLPALGADTDVVLDGRILGKPADAEDAARLLAALAGREHEVVSAVVLVGVAADGTPREESLHTVTRVRFAALTSAQIARYVASSEPFGKAGAYAIQGLGAALVERVAGSVTGVIGLPLAETCALLARWGIEPG